MTLHTIQPLNNVPDDFGPDDYPERSEKDWDEPLASAFIESIRQNYPKDLILLEEWTTNSQDFNNPIKDEKFTSAQADKINGLSRIINGYRIPENMRTYRAISMKTYRRFMENNKNFHEGAEVTIDEFSATSMSQNASRKTIEDFARYKSIRPVEFEFLVPAGSNAIPLSKAPPYDPGTGHSVYEFKKEWLLQRGTRIRVLTKTEFQNGGIRIVALVIDTSCPKEI